MPTKITLETIQSQLPSFVQIIPESYKGKRYVADFVDLDYNVPFKAVVASVIAHQYGCTSRANAKRSKPYGPHKTLDWVKSQLPSYLSIYPETWKGYRYKARFKDLEYNEDFEAYCFNVIRTNTGYCPSRKASEFRKSVMLKTEDIQGRLNQIYGAGFVALNPETYQGTGKLAQFRRSDGKQVTCTVDLALQGMLNTNRGENAAWRETVLERDGYICQITGKPGRLHVHHIQSKSSNPELRFNLNNGITLGADLHTQFHSRYGKTQNTVAQLIEFAKGLGKDLTLRFKIT